GGKSALELVAALNGAGDKSGMDLVREYWEQAAAGQTAEFWTVESADTFDKTWRKALHDGFIGGTAALAGDSSAPAAPAGQSAAMTGLEINFRPDPTILDGRFANNGWLQELPKPLTKITWD